MASKKTGVAMALICAVSAGSAMASAGAQDKADLNQEVTLRCIYDMGEFGEDAVQACMRAEVAAAEALTGYPPQAQGIVDRCTKTWWPRGYQRVQVCVDQDIAAEAALAGYGEAYAQAIRACEEKAGAQGPAGVKRCVDAVRALPAKEHE